MGTEKFARPNFSRTLCCVSLFVAASAFSVFLFFVPGSVYWLDSPEFMAAASGLGLAHPPGHPVALLGMKLSALLPFASIPFRINLFSAFFGAIAGGLVAAISFVVTSARTSMRGAAVAAIFSGLLFTLCRSMFFQALAAEVYTLNAVLLLGAVFVLVAAPAYGLRPDDARTGAVAGVLLGLAIANHHYLTILAVPAIVAAFWVDRRSLRPLLVAMFVAAGVSLASYLYLPVRSLAGGWPTWAAVDSPGSFLWYASASIFSTSLGTASGTAPSVQDIGNGALALVLVGRSLTPASLVFALGGLYMLVRVGPRRHAICLLLLAAGGFASKMVMGILDPSNPDDHGYFLMALAAMAILTPVLPAVIGEMFPRAGRGRILYGIVAGAIMLVVLGFAASGGLEIGRKRAVFDDTDQVANLVFQDIPNRAVVLISHYPVFFLAQYQQEVEGRRPDVTVLQQSLYYKARGGHAYAVAMARRDNDLKPLMDAFLSTGHISWPELKGLSADRPVMIEASPDFKLPSNNPVSHSGWFFRLDRPNGSMTDSLDFLDVLRPALWSRAARNIETRRVVVRNLAAGAEWLDTENGHEDAVSMLKAAYELNPRDQTVIARLAALGVDVSGDDRP